MANQYLAVVEETTRGTDPGSGYKFLPVTGKLQPSFKPKDEPRKEFRGADTALGDSSVIRQESNWSHTVEGFVYPGAETGLFLKHLLGKAGTRSTVDTSAKGGIIYPLAMPYGTGLELAAKAIGLVPNCDEEGTTKAQYYGGGRIKSMSINGKGSEDVKISFEMAGAGEWIGAADQTATSGVSWPAANPFNNSHVSAFIGTGITRTGTAPDFTAIAPGTMTQFYPDDWSIKITNGLEDVDVTDTVRGAGKTRRNNQVSVEVEFSIDYSDPASGFSSADEYKALFAGTKTNSILIKLDNGDLAGDATQTYQWFIDVPLALLESEPPDRSNEGKTPMLKLKYKSLYDATAKYPVALFTYDKASSY